MTTRTVRLDPETEIALQEIKRITGMSISEVIKLGILSVKEHKLGQLATKPYEVYKTIQFDEQGFAVGSARTAKNDVANIIRKKKRK